MATFDANRGDLIQVLAGHSDQVNFADFSPDDQQIVSASNDGTLRIWDMATGKQLDIPGGSRGPSMAADFNTDGTRLAAGIVDGTAIVWDVTDGQKMRLFPMRRPLGKRHLT